jgi:hypothetical protein
MTPAWAQRQEELLRDCIVSPDVFNPMVDRLRDFVVPYQHVLETEASQRNGVWLFCNDTSNPGCSVSYPALSYNQDFPPETICSGGRAVGISENLVW